MLPGTGIWWGHLTVVIWNITGQGYNRAQPYRPKGGKLPAGARVLLMDGTAVESAFALLLTKVTKPPYPAQISFLPYLALFISEGGENSGNEKDDQWYDWKRFYRPQ